MTRNQKSKTTLISKILRCGLSIFFAALVLTLFSSSDFAQASTCFRKVKFARGQISATLRGTVKGETIGCQFNFRARAGQTVSISVAGHAKFGFGLSEVGAEFQTGDNYVQN